jgi:diacylglycerol kinase (ATP)
MFKRVYVIINPAAGQDEPILSYLNAVFRKHSIFWDVAITHSRQDATAFAKRALTGGYDLVAAYGGDGTVMEVAHGMHNKNLPLAIIPGGTANIMAKELGIPIDTREAINLIAGKNHKLRAIDMGFMNNEPFLLRLTMGDLAHMVLDTNRQMKNKLGQLAYGLTAVKQIGRLGTHRYRLSIDGKKIQTTGSSLIITNSGNVGIQGVSLIESISVSDGSLDVILLKDTTLGTLTSFATNIVLKNKPRGTIRHWRGKNITVRMDKQPLIHDDFARNEEKLDIITVPKALSIVVPK